MSKLIDCPACQNQVSPDAKTCPKCGAPVTALVLKAVKARRAKTWRKFLVGVVLLWAVGAFLQGTASDEKKAKRLAELKETNPAAYYTEYARKEIAAKEREDRAARRERCSDAVSAFTFARSAMRERLKAPSTAKLASITGSTTQDLECGVYSVRSYVDAQNSFGAMIRTHFVARVRHLGDDRWTLEQMETR